MALPCDPNPALPRWVRFGPGVAWLLERPTSSIRFEIDATAAQQAAPVAASRVRQWLSDAGARAGFRLSDQIFALFTTVGACLYAGALLRGWRGMADPTTGCPCDHRDTSTVETALLHGFGPDRPALLVPFIGWLNQPDGSMAGDVNRARQAAAAGPMPTFTNESAAACWKIVHEAPGLWVSDANGSGLDFARCMEAFEVATGTTIDVAELGAAFKIFAAIDDVRSGRGRGCPV